MKIISSSPTLFGDIMKLLLAVLIILYNLTILAGTAYLVQVYNWSGWWFAFAILILMSIDLKEKS